MQTVRVYDADRQQLRATHTQSQAVLDACFEDDTAAFAAGLEGSVQRCCPGSGCDVLDVVYQVLPFPLHVLSPRFRATTHGVFACGDGSSLWCHQSLPCALRLPSRDC